MKFICRFICWLKERIENYKEQKRYNKENNIKCMAVCNACKHSHFCADFTNDCRECEQYGGGYECICNDVEYGEACEYFKPIESEGKK